ncbi:oligosaccharide flippase family protein [uncultured Cloacibacillus sp.]|uniref:lipopolysaccharide biosynthesis protein n=2 Tax=Cloacibacillus TaxID=508459 RepID=UPI0027D9A566|nr:oligosaccharide flippase family protein [uncultured Cloacibacillus sp.]
MLSNRAKLFIENFIAYGAINALDKIVPLVMLPIVTRLLTDSADYGRFEMFNTIVGFGSAFAILGIYDAMFREYFEKDDEEYKSLVTSTAAKIVFFSACIVSLILVPFSKAVSVVFLNTSENWHIVVMAAFGVFLSANRAIISAPTRMKNQRKVYIFSGISYSAIYYAFAILFIKLGMSYNGLIYGNLIASLYMFIFFFYLNHRDFKLGLFSSIIAKELLKIGVPLVPCFVIYWAFNSMDKIMISHMLGLKEVGIYSIGAKVASVSTFIYAAFAGGWQYFAFSTMKDKDQVELTSKIFEYLGILSFGAYEIAILLNHFVFYLFFSGEYIQGSIVFPYLFLSPLILMLFQTAGNQLLVIKKSIISTLCLTLGLFLNLLLNYLIIPIYGVKGAALATLSGYCISALSLSLIIQKLKLLHIRFKFIILALIILIHTFIFFYKKNSMLLNSLFIFIFLAIFIFSYRKEISKSLKG